MNLPQFPRDPACSACALHTFAKNRCVPTIWMPGSLPPSPTTPVVLFIGQNPGFNEDAQCEPFVGKSGAMVRKTFCEPLQLVPAFNNPSRATVYLSNTARCYTPAENPPTQSQYKKCSDLFLIEDLAQILIQHQRVCVVTLGAPAATQLFRLCGQKDISFVKARSLSARPLIFPWLSLPSCPNEGVFHYVSCYHPAAVMRTPSLIHTVAEQLSAVTDWLNNTTPTATRPTIVPPYPPR